MPAVAPPLTPHAHPIKTEHHDTQSLLHHTNTGVRQVNVYQETSHGLFVARDFAAHPRIRHWQAHLLPKLNLVICRYDFHGPREHDYYMDVAQITREGDLWAVRDFYLDIVLHDGLAAEIVDTEELLESQVAGFITEPEVQESIAVAHQTLSGLAQAGYNLKTWLAAQQIALDWLGTQ